ncbi:MAG: GNAT family N-acetyltransferase [Bacillaceae bacterium]|nr:GNAT family N-acetyltransferase [Bacillaceae bacterium]
MNQIDIRELKTSDDIAGAFPVMSQLRPHLDRDTYLDLVTEAQQKERYKLLALYDEGKIVAVIGFKPMITLYYGRFVWVCDLVTEKSQRSKGYGEKLLLHVHDWAERNKSEIISATTILKKRA